MSAKAGGDDNGQNLQGATYEVNPRNQYVNRTVVPGVARIVGAAKVSATVEAYSGITVYPVTSRKGESFWRAITLSFGVPLIGAISELAVVMSRWGWWSATEGKQPESSGAATLGLAKEEYSHSVTVRTRG